MISRLLLSGMLLLTSAAAPVRASSSYARPQAPPRSDLDCTWTPATPRPGEPVRVRLVSPPWLHVEAATLDRLPLLLQPDGSGGLQGLGAIGRREAVGERELLIRVRTNEGRRLRYRYTVPVEARPYPVDRLKVRADLATPPEPLTYRLFHEASAQGFQPQAEQAVTLTPWLPPVPGKVTSAFGKVRYFNGRHRGSHLGVDLRAASGTQVLAPAPGRVLDTRKEYLGGLTLRVDHGDGWISHFMHLSRIDTAVGQVVRGGQRLAEVGSSGRVTGPHLHWAVTWRGRYVDPMNLVEELP